MKVLINSSVVRPHVESPRYQGIERLGKEFAIELTALGHEVTVTAPEGSQYPENIGVITVAMGGADAENASFPAWRHRLGEFDVIHDFSHLHSPALTIAGLPTLNVFWHDPHIAQFMEPGYNIIGLSQYAVEAFREIYKQDARHQETIVVDLEKYKSLEKTDSQNQCQSASKNKDILKYSPRKKPVRIAVQSGRNDLKLRFLSLGLMLPLKGHLEAMRLCRKLGVALDVVGGKMPTDDGSYMEIVQKLCDGYLIKFWGDVDDGTKISLMQSAAALVYPVGQLEIHSHKSVEAMACGCPVIAWDKGAMREVLGDGGGLVADNEAQFLSYMETIEDWNLNPAEWATKWGVHKVVADYIPLYEEVANGLRW